MGNMVKINSYTGPKTILIAPELAFTIPVIVKGATTSDKKTIIKAGSPLGGSVSVLENRQTPLEVSGSDGAQGILLHDVDVTDGDANGTLVVSGYIDLNRIDEDVEISTETKGFLHRIVFMKGE